MNKPEHHFLVCASFRLSGDPQGKCHRKGAVSLMQHLEEEILDREINATVSSTGCMKQCEKGPVMVVYPSGYWYGNVDEDIIDTVLDAIENGRVPAVAQLG
ncbi:MAG: (2Fe-2S) ferredoxin domain-containing protein [Chloroflexota bacterium]|nr:MAG: (2Fe-2S) ferredoxin domain-containing protein [Chloroflexota bacterium]